MKHKHAEQLSQIPRSNGSVSPLLMLELVLAWFNVHCRNHPRHSRAGGNPVSPGSHNMAVSQQLCMKIRDEDQNDISAIQNIHRRAFGGDYEPKLVEMLRNAGRVSLSLVADVEDEVVGHVLFSPVTFDPPLVKRRWVALGPIGVLPEHQGRGIGSRMVRQGLHECRSAGWDGVVLLGSPGYYSRFGFVQASHHSLSSEFGDGAAFQATELRQGALEEVEGKVLYPPEFRET